MNKILSILPFTALSALALAGMPVLGAAQEAAQDAERDVAAQEAERDVAVQDIERRPIIEEEIEVVAPRTVRERLPLGRGEQVSMSYRVSFGDLDLTQTADVRTLEERISDAAHDVCQQLATLYPQGDPEPDVCARRATETAMTRAREAISAAVE